MKRNATLIAKYAITVLCLLSSLFLLVGYAAADVTQTGTQINGGDNPIQQASLAANITWQIECVD